MAPEHVLEKQTAVMLEKAGVETQKKLSVERVLYAKDPEHWVLAVPYTDWCPSCSE